MVSRDRSPQGGRGGRGRGGRAGGPAREGDNSPSSDRGASREARDERRQRRRSRDTSEESGLIERVVQIRRVSKVVQGGRNLTFNAMVVVGDSNGNVGASLGKSNAVPDAVRKGTTQARKRMQKMTLSAQANSTTIPHDVVARFSGSLVLLKPAAPGTGIIAGGGVRAVMEAAGVTDVLSKTYGSTNTINIVKATLKGLQSLRDPRAVIARRRGVAPAPEAAATASAEPAVAAPASEG